MRKTLNSEILKEMPNQEALGAFNSAADSGVLKEEPILNGYKKLPTSELVNHMNEKYGFQSGLKFTEWVKGDIHRVYVNNQPNSKEIYNTGKVKQTAYVDVKTGNVKVFTDSNQPIKWNINQSKDLANRLEKYGRYIKRFQA